jgi:hypothetical protein
MLQPRPAPVFIDAHVVREKLRALRQTQRALAESIDFPSEGRLSLILRGLLAVQPAFAERIADALGFDDVATIVSRASAATDSVDDNDGEES